MDNSHMSAAVCTWILKLVPSASKLLTILLRALSQMDNSHVCCTWIMNLVSSESKLFTLLRALWLFSYPEIIPPLLYYFFLASKNYLARLHAVCIICFTDGSLILWYVLYSIYVDSWTVQLKGSVYNYVTCFLHSGKKFKLLLYIKECSLSFENPL